MPSKGKQAFWPAQHAGVCDHCHHSQFDIHEITVTFEVKVERGQKAITRNEMIDALLDGLPKEWWWDDRMADWGLKLIK